MMIDSGETPLRRPGSGRDGNLEDGRRRGQWTLGSGFRRWGVGTGEWEVCRDLGTRRGTMPEEHRSSIIDYPVIMSSYCRVGEHSNNGERVRSHTYALGPLFSYPHRLSIFSHLYPISHVAPCYRRPIVLRGFLLVCTNRQELRSLLPSNWTSGRLHNGTMARCTTRIIRDARVYSLGVGIRVVYIGAWLPFQSQASPPRSIENSRTSHAWSHYRSGHGYGDAPSKYASSHAVWEVRRAKKTRSTFSVPPPFVQLSYTCD
ncbi:hypothetical protein BDN71DRAFT_880589 [Pleurotus eryngii]|uniref:Uncharacterized protein n=1 Tax=Pleurotus eryngii TaxID=5323 RepID=A0A9P5ZWY2_PLEER|nr:hypothetical protein BDN71DRAFT_880589 [Pleurotus eryngii]